MDYGINAFTKGIHNLLPEELIPSDAASNALNWITKDGRIELAYGRQTQGGDGAAGRSYGEHTGYRVDGTAVRFRKVDGVIQYLNGSTWTDVITGLSNSDVTFSNYQSLAGAFVYIFGLDGIYKICTANPANYASLYEAAKNFKGYAFIDKARAILWGRTEDPTGFYGSYIDAQNSTVYTSVSAEATTSLGGTLAFKSGGARRTCFGVQITITASGEIYTDNYNGVLTGSLGGNGTINYMTGAYTLSNPGVGTANYQWEDSNAKGVTDFTKSATRLAGEGFVLRQDAGGDAIKLVVPALDGTYFSFKTRTVYKVDLDATDLAPTNLIFRTDIGVPTLRSAVATGLGVVFINTANTSKPRLEILERNPQGDAFVSRVLFSHFKFENYLYNDAVVDSWDKFILLSCREDSDDNNRLLLCDPLNETVDVTTYGARCFAKANGYLYAGDPVSKTTYELFTGFDDLGIVITNCWESKADTYEIDDLKKPKRVRYRGRISPQQAIAVYLSGDNADYQLIGTIRGDGDYVDYSSTYAIGTSYIGQGTVGGDDTTSVYDYFFEIKVHTSKYRKRKVKFVATGLGYASIEAMQDRDIWTYTNKLPKHYRTKQNVSLDGQTTDIDEPTY